MRTKIYDFKQFGYTDDELNSGVILNPDHDIEYDPSLTDQTFNISIQSQVEDFVASGKLISAMHQGESVEVPVENRLDSFYGDDLPDVTQRIYAFNARQKQLEEEQKKLSAEKKKIDEILAKAKKASQTHEA